MGGCRQYMDDPNTFLNSEASEDIAEGYKNQRGMDRTVVATQDRKR